MISLEEIYMPQKTRCLRSEANLAINTAQGKPTFRVKSKTLFR